jgi:CPA2 family monovalent cation:H+ antiporter-2
MSEVPILKDLVLVIAVCLIAVYALRRAGIPPFVAFIAAGVLVGPGGLNIIDDIPTIDIMAQIGVIFLLFAIGLRFSLEDFFRMRWLVLGAGSLQVSLTILATALIAWATGVHTPRAIFFGFLVAQSSTTVILKIVESRGEVESPHARFMLSVSIFQDLAAIPLMLLLPVLGRAEEVTWLDAVFTLAKSFAMVIIIIVAARSIIPWVIEKVVHTRSREIFTFTAILIALGTAYLSEQAGLSLALGAFVAGLVISESQYSHQVLAEIGALRDALASLFFVSIGMLFDPRTWLAAPLLSGGLVGGVILLKAVIVVGIALLFGFGGRIAVLAALGLAQVGEFSYILVYAARPYGFLEGDDYQQFLSISVMTMTLAPLAVMAAPAVSQRLQQWRRQARAAWRARRWKVPRSISGRPRPLAAPPPEAPPPLARHVLIVGYGVNGRNVARVLRRMRVKFVVLELNPLTVRSIRRQEESVIYGDATQAEILEKAGIQTARVLIVAIADARAARQVVAIARSLKRDLTIIVRTRFVAEVEKLRELGADFVVPEEFETSIALVARVMAIYGASEQMIEQQEEMLRSEHYEALREDAPRALRSPALREMLAHADFAEITLPADSPSVGQPIRTLDLRGRTGASIMGISRDRAIIGNPGPDFILEAGDVVGVLGTSAEVAAAKEYLVRGGG